MGTSSTNKSAIGDSGSKDFGIGDSGFSDSGSDDLGSSNLGATSDSKGAGAIASVFSESGSRDSGSNDSGSHEFGSSGSSDSKSKSSVSNSAPSLAAISGVSSTAPQKLSPEFSQRLAEWSARFEGRSPSEILAFASEQFGAGLTFATGFGVEGCLLIDLVGRNRLPIDLFTLDTGLLFPETYELWRRLEARYGRLIRGVKSELSLHHQAQIWGKGLWEREPARCCDIRKVQPLRKELTRFSAWITAIRRDQTPERAKAQIFEWDAKFSLVKVNPLVAWSSKDVWREVVAREIPYNPLHNQNYPSIGCEPCTSPVMPGEDPRAGRWRQSGRRECGLHSGDETQAPGLSLQENSQDRPQDRFQDRAQGELQDGHQDSSQGELRSGLQSDFQHSQKNGLENNLQHSEKNGLQDSLRSAPQHRQQSSLENALENALENSLENNSQPPPLSCPQVPGERH